MWLKHSGWWWGNVLLTHGSPLLSQTAQIGGSEKLGCLDLRGHSQVILSSSEEGTGWGNTGSWAALNPFPSLPAPPKWWGSATLGCLGLGDLSWVILPELEELRDGNNRWVPIGRRAALARSSLNPFPYFPEPANGGFPKLDFPGWVGGCCS